MMAPGIVLPFIGEGAGLVQPVKEGLRVNDSLADCSRSPYAASLPDNLMHWFADNPDVRALIEKGKSLRRETTYGISG
jgi:hypothetical protein